MVALRLLLMSLLLAVPALAEGTAIFPVKLLDSSNEVRDQHQDHDRRQALFAEILAQALPRARLIDDAALDICQPQTAECLLALARDLPADEALFIVVQKTSTLILQVFAHRVDTATGDLLDSHELSFRGDNDEAWRRAARFLADQLAPDR